MDRQVSFFLPSLKGGGAEKSILTLAKGLGERGLEVSLVLSKAEGAHLNSVPKSLEVVDLGTRSVWKSIPGLIRHLQRARPNVLISALDHANVAAIVAKQLSGVDLRIAVTTHTMVSIASRLNNRVSSAVVLMLMRRLYPASDVVVAVSKAVAADLSEIAKVPQGLVRVIYNPVDTNEVVKLSDAPAPTTWFGPNAPPVVVAVGSLWPHKDHETLIRAFSLAKHRTPLRLAILGEGPQRARLFWLVRELGLEKDVIMPGFVSNPYAWMARSAVFVLPSRWEGFSNALVEAMACGVTPVVTDCPGGPAEIIEDGKYGMITPVGDARGMARAILDSLNKPFSSTDLRERAECFSLERAVDRYMGLVINPSA